MGSSAFRAMRLAAALLGLATPCFGAANPRNGDIRLVGSIDYYYDDDRRVVGRLVVHYNGQWGNVCGYDNAMMHFSDLDTKVACEQLGDLEYYRYDDEGMEYEWPEDAGLAFLQRIYCLGDERHLSECPLITWTDQDDYHCWPKDYARSISCAVPPAEDVVDPEFVFDVGFSDSGIKCLRADGFVPHGTVYDEIGGRRRRGTPRTQAPTLPPFTPTPMPTPAPTLDDFEAHVDASRWEVAACRSVYSGAGDGEVEILHKGQFSNNEVCARRADGQPWQNLYLRLLCRVVDLNSSMVSYTSKGCGPRGADATADTSHCLLGASAVATVLSEPPFPAAIVEGCAFFSYTEYLCLESTIETETETTTNTTLTSTTTATGCVDYVPPEEEKWHDADGEFFDCVWYAAGPDCSQLGGGARHFNRTADEACCACGGGVAGPRTTTTRTATTASDTQVSVTFTDTTTSTSTAVTSAAQAGASGDEGGGTTDAAVVLNVLAAVLAGIALMLTGVAGLLRRLALKAQQATNVAAPMKASAESAGARSHASDVLAV